MSFEAHRPALFRFAYGMLGSVASAEDVVQEAWIRFQRTSGVDNPAAWLRTVVGRLALDELRSARAQRVSYTGPWLPEPLPTDVEPPADPAVLAEALSMATLAVLEQLTPAERAAFLLREVFDADYPEVAALLQRSEPATRQLVRRARQHLAAHRPRFEADPGTHEALLGAFGLACATGDLDGLKALLADDVVLTSDGGGRVPAALRPVRGPDRVARFFLGQARKPASAGVPTIRILNGQLGLTLRGPHGVHSALVFSIAGGRITAIHTVRNPDKLAHLQEAAGPQPPE